MSAPTMPPVEFDEYALVAARRLAAVDRNRLPGADSQFKAILQIAIVDAMMHALTIGRGPHVTIRSNYVEFSPALKISDHEMDVLRALATRVKAQDFRKDDGSSPAFLRKSAESSTRAETQTGGAQ